MKIIRKSGMITATISVALIIITALVSFLFINSIIMYEPQITAAHDSNTTDNPISASSVNDIPESPYYRLVLKNDKLFVYDSNDNTVFITTDKIAHHFPYAEKLSLEQTGILVNSRSELLELLNYIDS